MGHVNNAKYLTYCEIARIRYWTDMTGEPIALGTEGAESLILAEARITYRAPVFHGEVVTVETRAAAIGRTSFTLEHRLLAASRATPRLVAVSESVLVRYDYAAGAPVPLSRMRTSRRSRHSRVAPPSLRPAVDDAPEDRDRVLAAEPEPVDGGRLDPRLAGGERHVVEVALGVGRASGWPSAG